MLNPDAKLIAFKLSEFFTLSRERPKGAIATLLRTHVRSEKAAIPNPRKLIFQRPDKSLKSTISRQFELM